MLWGRGLFKTARPHSILIFKPGLLHKLMKACGGMLKGLLHIVRINKIPGYNIILNLYLAYVAPCKVGNKKHALSAVFLKKPNNGFYKLAIIFFCWFRRIRRRQIASYKRLLMILQIMPEYFIFIFAGSEKFFIKVRRLIHIFTKTFKCGTKSFAYFRILFY